MRFYNLLSFRLFLLIVFFLTILTIGYSFYFVELETAQYEEVARQCAQRTSEIIIRSTKNAMLLNQKDNAYDIMNSVAMQEGIEKICLYSKEGEIIFSTIGQEIGGSVPLTNKACAPCHRPTGEIKPEPSNNWHQIFISKNGFRSLGYLSPVQNEVGCTTSACHVHNAEEKYLGVLCVVMSLEKMDILVEENRSRMISTNIAITIILGLIAGLFLWIGVHLPVNRLIQGTREVSSGNLSYNIEDVSKDEMGILARSFNEMTNDLRAAKEEITTWSNQLEKRVKDKTEELEQTQTRNLQIEKMASLGQLSATVAHELNNPMAGILTYSKLIQKKINKERLSEEEKASIIKHLKMIEKESARSGDIVKNMLLFSRQDDIHVKLQPLDILINSSLDLIDHHLKLNNIQLETNFQKNLPEVYVDENQIKQALLALYVNAVEAMENEGTMTVRTLWNRSGKFVSVFVADTGRGIPNSVKSQIFEPFFTTKNAVKGVGLGLASVYAIIERHGGEITVESQVDVGTTFEIKIFLNKTGNPKNE